MILILQPFMSDSSILSATTVLHNALICETEFFWPWAYTWPFQGRHLGHNNKVLSSCGPHCKSKWRCPFMWATVDLRINGRHFHPFSSWDLKLTGIRPLLLNYLMGGSKKNWHSRAVDRVSSPPVQKKPKTKTESKSCPAVVQVFYTKLSYLRSNLPESTW